MKRHRLDRREFLAGLAGSAAVAAHLTGSGRGHLTRSGQAPSTGSGQGPRPATAPRIKFGVIGLNHGHIYSQTEAVLRGGGELVSVYAKEPDLVAAFVKRFPQAKVARTEAEILEDRSTQLVLSASIPDERAP